MQLQKEIDIIKALENTIQFYLLIGGKISPFFACLLFVMSLINFFSLGGIQETGKNLYVLEIDKDLFVFDCGMKYPPSDYYGIDLIMPDITYLCLNSRRIKGIFLSHAHDDHIGAIAHILKNINIPVYGSSFTIDIVKGLLKEYELNPDDYELNKILPNQELRFGFNVLTFIEANHSIPGSMMIDIKTRDGHILYTGNYNFDQNAEIKTDIKSLVKLKDDGVLLLLAESISTNLEINRSLNENFKYLVQKEIEEARGRTIISIFSTNLNRIKQVIDIAAKKNKKVCIIGRKTQRIVSAALDGGYLNISKDVLVNLRFRDENNNNDSKDYVCLVCGERHEPYYMLQRMIKGYDRLIQINEKDKVIIMTRPHLGTEKMAAHTLDLLYRKTDDVVIFPKELLMSASSSSEEVKQLINLLNPKYILPVIGEYRHQYFLKNTAINLGYDDKNIIIPELGEIHSFYDKKYIGIPSKINVGDILLEGKGFNDVPDQVLKDRLLLSESGMLVFVANINAKDRKKMSKPEIITKGFYLEKRLEKGIIKLFDDITEEVFKGKFINWVTYKQNVKSEIVKYIEKETGSNPLVIAQIISTEL